MVYGFFLSARAHKINNMLLSNTSIDRQLSTGMQLPFSLSLFLYQTLIGALCNTETEGSFSTEGIPFTSSAQLSVHCINALDSTLNCVTSTPKFSCCDYKLLDSHLQKLWIIMSLCLGLIAVIIVRMDVMPSEWIKFHIERTIIGMAIWCVAVLRLRSCESKERTWIDDV